MSRPQKSYFCSALATVLLLAFVIGILKFTAWKSSKASSSFRYESDNTPPGGAPEGEYKDRLARAEVALRVYSAAHSAGTVLNDPGVCSRRFVLAGYPTLNSLGDSVYEFLNAHAVAILLNRTIVGAHPPAGESSPWESRWIVDIADLRAVWRERKCGAGKELSSISLSDSQVAGLLACCAGTSVDATMISVCTPRHTVHALRAHAHAEGNTTVAGVRTLFGLDGFTFYGLLLRNALQIPPSGPRVIKAFGKIENYHTAKDLVTFGLHMKHTSVGSAQVKKDLDIAIRTLKRLIPKYTASYRHPCAILMASNRAELFELADSERSLLGCSVTKVERFPGEKATEVTDTGLWPSSSVVVDDISLLARSDVFVGSRTMSGEPTSVSLLIADLLASGQLNQQINVYWMDNVAADENWKSQHHSGAEGNYTATGYVPTTCTGATFCSPEPGRRTSCRRLQGFEETARYVVRPLDRNKGNTGRYRPDGRPVIYNPKYDFRNRSIPGQSSRNKNASTRLGKAQIRPLHPPTKLA